MERTWPISNLHFVFDWNQPWWSAIYVHIHSYIQVINHHQSMQTVSLTFSLVIHPYHPSLLVSPLDSIQYLHRADECKVFAGHVRLVCPWVGIHWRMLLISLSLLLHQCPACLVHLTLMVCEIGGKWHYRCCFYGAISRIC